MKKDPVCGMKVDEKEAEKKSLYSVKNKKKYYFCSQKCKNKFENVKEQWYKSEEFSKYFPYFLAALLIGGTALSIYFGFMVLYMGIFFIIFSLMKMLDWNGFVNAFQTYDLLAMNSKTYAWIYPGLEFVLGIVYLSNLFIPIAAWVTLFIMGIGGIGVGKKLLTGEKFQCACLGTKINLPLTKVTLLENSLMFFMALLLILRFY